MFTDRNKPWLYDAVMAASLIKGCEGQVNTIAVFLAIQENERMARNRQPTQEKLDAAFSDLLAEISAGREYPDAVWTITQRHGVPSEAMQEMYDAQHD